MNKIIEEISKKLDILLENEKETNQLFRDKIVECAKKELLRSFQKQKNGDFSAYFTNTVAMTLGVIFRQNSFGRALLDSGMASIESIKTSLEESETRLNSALIILDRIDSDQLLRLICICQQSGFEESIKQIK